MTNNEFSMEAELARLEKSKQRRHQREKGRKRRAPGSPSADAASPDADGETSVGGKDKATTRKCANCGQVGHIKTNKKCVHCDLPIDRNLPPSSLAAVPMLLF